MIFKCCGTSKQKQCRATTIKKAHPALGKKKVLVSTLNRFNKTYNVGDSIKTCVLAWRVTITNQKLSKALFLPEYVTQSITMQSMPVSLNIPCTLLLHQTSSFYLHIYAITIATSHLVISNGNL